MKDKNAEVRHKDEEIKLKWGDYETATGVNVPVNQIQYEFDSAEREASFISSQFSTEKEREKYLWYRNEWHRRPKEFDPGPAPLAVTCELVSSCDLACSMCYTITNEFANIVTGAQRVMPWPIVKSIIDEAAELGVPSMLFSWRGESSLYKGRDGDKKINFADVLKYARSKGILEITSLTHGQHFTEELARQVVDAEPSWISFSFDGIGENYNNIRTPKNKKGTSFDAFAVVVENIKRLRKIRDDAGKSRPQIRSNTIFPAIENNPKGYQEFMRDIGVDLITINEMLDLRDGEVPEDMIMENWACQYPFQRLTVSANGIVLPCTGAHKEQTGLVLGRYEGTPPKKVRNLDGSYAEIEVSEFSLKDAWNSDKIKKIRELHKTGKRTEIDPGCRHCNHGVKKFGVDRMPGGWDKEKQMWSDKTRVG
jgi:MoaA/NifB/PqqE/SkfB family radical SAM enzyme